MREIELTLRLLPADKGLNRAYHRRNISTNCPLKLCLSGVDTSRVWIIQIPPYRNESSNQQIDKPVTTAQL